MTPAVTLCESYTQRAARGQHLSQVRAQHAQRGFVSPAVALCKPLSPIPTHRSSLRAAPQSGARPACTARATMHGPRGRRAGSSARRPAARPPGTRRPARSRRARPRPRQQPWLLQVGQGAELAQVPWGGGSLLPGRSKATKRSSMCKLALYCHALSHVRQAHLAAMWGIRKPPRWALQRQSGQTAWPARLPMRLGPLLCPLSAVQTLSYSGMHSSSCRRPCTPCHHPAVGSTACEQVVIGIFPPNAHVQHKSARCSSTLKQTCQKDITSQSCAPHGHAGSKPQSTNTGHHCPQLCHTAQLNQ